MIDTINPMSLDLTKNLHGHVRVELRDRWTGRVVDSQEKDNLVTNVVQELVAAQVWMGGSNSAPSPMFTDICPIWSKALGGLLLFNGTLTASATNTSFPSSVKLVGCAGQTASSDSAIIGSLNTAESVYTSTGFTTTWDFLTSQANGTIASLARTSNAFISNSTISASASFTYGSDTSVTPTAVAYLGYDKTNGYLYLGLTSAATIGGTTYPRTNIYRVKADFDNIGLITSYLPPASKWTSIKTLSSSDGSANATDFAYDKYENNFIYATGTTLHIVAIDGTHTTKTLTGTSGNIGATENYYWRADNNTVYCIPKTNLSNAVSMSVPGYLPSVVLSDADSAQASGGGLSNAQQRTVLYPDGTTISLNGQTGYYGSGGIARNVGYFTAANNGPVLKFPSSYLGTIANLDSPVTKTSSQTMKITYTLTEA